MATRTVVCPECDEAVPYGRLSCPGCGSLLASVVGGPRRDEPGVAPDAEHGAAPVPVAPRADPAVVPAVLRDWAPPPPPPTDDAPLRQHLWATPRADEGPPVLYPSAQGVSVASAPAGAWLPPTVPPARAAPSSAAASVAPAATPADRPGDAPLLADLPFDAPDDLPGWLVTIGSAVATAGFFLPWSELNPFTSLAGYTERWGLAMPFNWLVLGAVVLLLVVSLLPGRVPAWIRVGVAPIALGGLLLGVSWPHLLGGFGAQIGALSIGLSSAMLVAGGTLALRPRRHGGPELGV